MAVHPDVLASNLRGSLALPPYRWSVQARCPTAGRAELGERVGSAVSSLEPAVACVQSTGSQRTHDVAVRRQHGRNCGGGHFPGGHHRDLHHGSVARQEELPQVHAVLLPLLSGQGEAAGRNHGAGQVRLGVYVVWFPLPHESRRSVRGTPGIADVHHVGQSSGSAGVHSARLPREPTPEVDPVSRRIGTNQLEACAAAS
uniref:(northern house mosquito) hypothetical protein n=1 Tax=Culex pipiens TaxID=7175 RepID=A0A8D8F2B0_CULPI